MPKLSAQKWTAKLPKPKMSKETYPIYEAQVGALGRVAFFKDPETKTYCFMFFNGADYTPLYISEDAAYYVWRFIGCEHPDCLNVSSEERYPARKTNVNNFTTAKKAGGGKQNKKPSNKVKKVKGKSYGKV